MSRRSDERAFTLGLIYSAWFLASARETTYAAFLLKESNIPVSTLRRLARKEEYSFPRGFWQEVQR